MYLWTESNNSWIEYVATLPKAFIAPYSLNFRFRTKEKKSGMSACICVTLNVKLLKFVLAYIIFIDVSFYMCKMYD